MALAERARPELSTELGATWLERFAAEHDNIRAVLERMIEHEQAEEAVRLTGAVWPFWMTRGHWTEGRRWLEAALDAPTKPIPWHSSMPTWVPRYSRSGKATSKRPRLMPGNCLRWRAATASFAERLLPSSSSRSPQVSRRLSSGTRLYEQALPLAYQTDDEWLVSIILNNLGDNALNLGDPSSHHLLRAKPCGRGSARRPRQAARALTNLGFAAQQLGDQPRARRYLEEGLAIAAEIGLQEILLFGLMVLAASIAGDDPSLSALLIGSIDEATEELHAFIDDLEAEQRRATIESLRDSLREKDWGLVHGGAHPHPRRRGRASAERGRSGGDRVVAGAWRRALDRARTRACADRACPSGPSTLRPTSSPPDPRVPGSGGVVTAYWQTTLVRVARRHRPLAGCGGARWNTRVVDGVEARRDDAREEDRLPFVRRVAPWRRV